ncbi:MAG TPA: NAD-dependent epimerase/dehydratase family protein [Mycobacteriales bacterium]|nr:NAD-dependent epimerase/dehydratase family protein [Mycobacteriales bacterium]HWC34256.1 NAD-dependent epimerase/dehydratase family protein [Mycobacteriales bacterium]
MAGAGALGGKRVLITGASGFIGSHLTRRLVKEGAKVHGLTSTVSSVYPARLLDIRDSITLHEASLDDRGAMELLADEVKPEYVFHLGAYTHVGKSWNRVDECIQTNIQGTVNLLMAVERTGFTRFLNTGTSEIYGDIEVPFREDATVHPISPYSVSKHAAEEYCRLFADARDLPLVRVRPFNAYGPMQSPDRVIPEIISRAVQKQPLKMTQGTQTREFNYVEDLADGFVALATAPGIDGDLFNLGCGREVSMRDIAVTILRLMGDPITPEFGALPERPIEIYRMHADVTKTRDRVGWTATISLEDGLQRTIDWYRDALASGSSPFAS